MKIKEGTVSVTIKGVDGKENSIDKPVSYNEVENTDDVLGLLQGDKESVQHLIDSLNYGFNLKARAKVTAAIKNENQGPEVALNSLVASIVKNRAKLGKPISETDARALALQFSGL